MKRELFYLQVSENKFIAGANLEQMLSSIEKLPLIYGGKKLNLVRKEDIPKEYSWSIRRAEEHNDWEKNGAYQLIPNFETYSRFRNYFPNEQQEVKQ